MEGIFNFHGLAEVGMCFGSQNTAAIKGNSAQVASLTSAEELLKNGKLETGDLLEIQVKRDTHFVIYYDNEQVLDICLDTYGARVRLVYLIIVAKDNQVNISKKTEIKLHIKGLLKKLMFPLPVYGQLWIDGVHQGSWLSDPQLEESTEDRTTYWMPVRDLKNEKLLPGDIIAFDRKDYIHFALYYCNDYVFDITASPIQISIAHVELKHIETVAGDFMVRIGNKIEIERPPFPRAVAVDRAFHDLGRSLYYNLVENNCEHYVTKWKYGTAFSEQVRKWVPIAKKIVKRGWDNCGSISCKVSSTTYERQENS